MLKHSLSTEGSNLYSQIADVIFINGNVYTLDESNPKADSLAVKGQELIYAGGNSGASRFIGPETKVLDLKGATVIPGLIEGHMHYAGLGQNLMKVNAFWMPKDEILSRVKAEAERLEAGEWILGHGWNQEIWPGKQFPTKEELDEVAPNNPVLITRACMHAVWVNSKALEAGGITRETPDPIGGEIYRDEHGNPSGILTDTANALVMNNIPQYSRERQKEALLMAQDELLSYGFTSCVDAATGIATLELFKELYDTSDLKLRIYAMVRGWDDARAYYKTGPEIGLFNDRLTARCVKFVADGSLGARSAWMLQEYSDRPGHFGCPRFSDDDLYNIVKEAIDHGFQTAVHAIGDATVHQCLNVYERIFREKPTSDHRCRIEHFQVAQLEDIERAAKLGVIPAMQTVHLISDKNMIEERIGYERVKGAYAWRKAINAGLNPVNGSDAPIEPVNPFTGMYAAVTRTDLEGNPPGGWHAQERMTREEALKSFTIWAAYGQFEEDIKGSLKEGKLADFTVLDRDYMTCDEDEIKDIKARMTIIGGEIMYRQGC